MKSLSPESFTTFGDLLRYLRQREKLTQRELSIAVGYSESQINRLEHNLRLPESSIVAAQFVPALHLEDEPEVAARLIKLAAQARGEPRPASLTFSGSAPLREPRTNLPAQMTSFIGREDEIAELTARARTTRMLTLTGAGGCGKTRLTLEVASQFVGATILRPSTIAQGAQDAVAPTTTTYDFRDGVWLIEFAPLSDASLVPRAVANVFGLADQPNASPTHVLTNYLASKHSDPMKALELCKQGLELCLGVGDQHEAASCLAMFAGVAVAQGQSIRAAKLFGAAEALLAELGIPMMYGDADDYEHDLSVLRAQLDEATLAAAWAEGQAMTLDQAIELALPNEACTARSLALAEPLVVDFLVRPVLVQLE